MYSCLRFVLFLTGAGASTTLLTRKKFGKVFPLTLMSLSLVMIVSGIFAGSLTPGYYAGIGWALLCVPLLLYRVLIRREGRELAGDLFSTGFFALALSICMVLVMDRRAMYSAWDEYSHWDPMVKAMLYDNTLYTTSTSSFAHHDYPPAAQLLEYFICRLNGRLDERYVYRMLQILTLSFFFPMVENLSARRAAPDESSCEGTLRTGKILYKAALHQPAVLLYHVSAFLASVLLLFVCAANQMNFFASIYKDLLLAVEGGYFFFLLWKFNGGAFDSWELGICAAFLLMTKQMGLTYLLIGMMLLLYRFIRERGSYTRGALIRSWLLFAGLPAFLYLSWNGLVRRLHLGGQFVTSSLIRNAWGFVTGTQVQDYQKSVVSLFCRALFKTTDNCDLSLFGLSFFTWFILFGLILAASVWAVRRGRVYLPEYAGGFLAVVWVGYAVYAVILLGLYVSGGFGEYEASILASYSRYMGSYVFSSFMLLLGILTENYRDSRDAALPVMRALCLLFVCAFFVTAWMGRNDMKILENLAPQRAVEGNNSFEITASRIEQYAGPDDSVLFVVQDDNGNWGICYNYYLIPRRTGALSVGTGSGGDANKTTMTPEGFAEQVSGYQYLYVARPDDEFNAVYAPAIGLAEAPKDSLYRIRTDPEGVRAELVESYD